MNPNLTQIPHPRKTGGILNRLILNTLADHKALTTDQVWALFYRGKRTGRRLAQMKMYSLFKAKKIKRIRFHFDEPYIYYYDKQGQWEHVIAVNWVWIYFKTFLSTWESIVYWKTEVSYKFIRPDGLIGIKNAVNGSIKYWFIEVDRAESFNAWDKVEKYNKLYEKQNMITGFPSIFVITTDPKRLIAIQDLTNDPVKNKHRLIFEIRLLGDLLKEVIK